MEKDITEKTLEAYNDVFADIINVFMFNGRQVIKEEELTDARARSYYKADGSLREQERDVAKYWHKNKFKIKELKPFISDYRINVFEVAFLTREQVELFQSDFKVVADYFVQMRENNDYIPSKETLEHVREVFDLMSVIAGDARFEEAYSEERSDTNMCEFLDRVEARGIIKGTVATCREFNMTDEQILSKICVQFQLDEKEAVGYL